jgi:hypothetical protein
LPGRISRLDQSINLESLAFSVSHPAVTTARLPYRSFGGHSSS